MAAQTWCNILAQRCSSPPCLTRFATPKRHDDIEVGADADEEMVGGSECHRGKRKARELVQAHGHPAKVDRILALSLVWRLRKAGDAIEFPEVCGVYKILGPNRLKRLLSHFNPQFK